MTLAGAFAIHELLEPNETSGSAPCASDDLHTNEAVGSDIAPNADGVWRDVLVQGQGKNGKGWGVSAGPIKHRGT